MKLSSLLIKDRVQVIPVLFMQNKRKTIIGLQALIVVLLYCSCSDKDRKVETVIIKDFPAEYRLDGTLVSSMDSLPIMGQMFITGRKLVVHQPRSKRPFRIYDLNNLNQNYEAGFIGHGANEFSFISSNYFAPQPDETFLLLDNYRLKHVSIRPDSSLETLSTQKTFDLLPINGFVKGGNLYISFADCATGTEGDMEFRSLDMKNKREQKFSRYPEFHLGDIGQDERCQLYYKRCVCNERKNRMAAFYSYFPYFRLYDDYTKLSKEVYFGERLRASVISKKTSYYGNIYATEKYIYAFFKTDIQVWNWEAEPVALLHFDRRVLTFAVDAEKGILYALVSDKEFDCYRFYTYRLPVSDFVQDVR